jgi:hypothetical protein
MKPLLLILFLLELLPFFSKAQLADEKGVPESINWGYDSLIIRLKKIRKIEVVQFHEAADTLKTGETVLQAEYDREARLILLKGCVHEGNDACIKEYNARLHYKYPGIISSAIFTHFDKGKDFYDSISYLYNEANHLKEADRFLYALNSSEEDTLRGISVYHYDRRGLLSTKELMGYINTIYPRIGYEHDSTGRIIKESYYDDKDQLAEANDLMYDKQGHQLSRKEYETHKLVCTFSNRLDKTGKCIEKKCFDANDSLTVFQTYKYDRQGRIVEEYTEPQHQELGIVTKYKYDVQGNLVEKKQSLANGKKIFRYTYRYNASNIMFEEIYFDSEDELNLIYKYHYTYWK